MFLNSEVLAKLFPKPYPTSAAIRETKYCGKPLTLLVTEVSLEENPCQISLYNFSQLL